MSLEIIGRDKLDRILVLKNKQTRGQTAFESALKYLTVLCIYIKNLANHSNS